MLGGIALLFASVLAGLIWDSGGPSATFLAGAAITTVGLVGLVALRVRMPGLGAPAAPAGAGGEVE
jgi:hypothetical protein